MNSRNSAELPLRLPEKIMEAYQIYKQKVPLDLKGESEKAQRYWQQNYQYSLLKYNQLLAI